MVRHCLLGCPQWSDRAWPGRFLPAAAGTGALPMLSAYAGLFNAVEGNTTFYAVPDAATVRRWGEEAGAGFRFCFKFPQAVTHRGRLGDRLPAAGEFLARMAPLGERLGPFLLQLPERFGPESLPQLDGFLGGLPREFRYVVEVRHPRLYDRAQQEERLVALLERHLAGRCTFDTRALFASAATDPHSQEARQRKPRLPLRVDCVAGLPFLRFVGSMDMAENEPLLAQWARLAARWVHDGLEPALFFHMPDNALAPALAARFHALLAQQADVGTLELPSPAGPGGQGELFG